MNKKRPREWAAELTDAWLTRSDSKKILENIPDDYRLMATTEARNCCNVIKYWSKIGYRFGMDSVPKHIKPNVVKYWQYRK